MRGVQLIDAETEKPPKFIQELLKHKFGVQLSLALFRKLHKNRFVLSRLQKIVPIVQPFEIHEENNIGADFLIYLFPVIEHGQN